MTHTTFQFYNKQILLQRILYSHHFKKTAPTVVFFGGIHGNEPAGVIGLTKVKEYIINHNISLHGNVYAIAGNLNALKKNIRYEKSDLNRLWTQHNITNLKGQTIDTHPEKKEQLELYKLIKSILSKNEGPFFFIDLHTTSSKSAPFITISDSLNNRKFTSNFPIPVILGIEEYLEGPLLTFINEFGHVSLGFEAGQHEDKRSTDNCIAFIWKVLVASNCIHRKQIKDFKKLTSCLETDSKSVNFFEVNYRYPVHEEDDFVMKNGFKNFDHIHQKELLAIHNEKEIKAHVNGQIFMPLYQKQGKDGFFIINKISNFWMIVSLILRKLKLHHILKLLPGIKQDASNKYTLVVNPKTAQFLATEIFHLFGYRKKISKNNKLYFIRRDREIIDLL